MFETAGQVPRLTSSGGVVMVEEERKEAGGVVGLKGVGSAEWVRSTVAQWLACWAHNPAVLRSKLSGAMF